MSSSPSHETSGTDAFEPPGASSPVPEVLPVSFGFMKASSTNFMRTLASAKAQDEAEGDDENEQHSSPLDMAKDTEQDEMAFFQSPSAGPILLGFQSAGFASASSLSAIDSTESFPDTTLAGFASASGLGFATASAKSVIAPSAAALAKAERMRKQWEEEDSTISDVDGPLDTSLPLLVAPTGFSTASSKGLLMPSAAALEKAKRMREEWERDIEIQDDKDDAGIPATPGSIQIAGPQNESIAPFQTPLKPPLGLQAVNNASPGGAALYTPTPAGAALTRPATQLPSMLGMVSTPSRPPPIAKPLTPLASTPGPSGFGKSRAKPFKSPLLSAATKSTGVSYAGSPLNPHRRDASTDPSGSRQVHPLSSTPTFPSGFGTPARPAASPAFTSPQRPIASLGVTPRRIGAPAVIKTRFATPFKRGMAPGEPGRAQMEQERTHTREPIVNIANSGGGPSPVKRGVNSKGKQREKDRFFDLSEHVALLAPRPPADISPPIRSDAFGALNAAGIWSSPASSRDRRTRIPGHVR